MLFSVPLTNEKRKHQALNECAWTEPNFVRLITLVQMQTRQEHQDSARMQENEGTRIRSEQSGKNVICL